MHISKLRPFKHLRLISCYKDIDELIGLVPVSFEVGKNF